MGLFDVVVIGVALVGYALGRARGLAWQISGLLTLLLGGAAATVLSRPVGALFHDGILGRFVGWIAVYAIVATALYVLTLSFREKLKEIEFDELDKRFGGVLGAVKALAVLAVITVVAVPLSPRVAQAVKPTPSGRVLSKLVAELRALLPERIPDTFAAQAAEPEQAQAPLEDPQRRPTAPAPTTPAPRPALPPQPPLGRPRLPDPDLGRTPPIAPPTRAFPEDEADAEDHVERSLTEDPFDVREDPADPLAPPK
ncbi:MAG: CvpA family protein [Planctomycetes bacterium]|nr:CvpA family protein [Planctomycetota bacterium]